MRSLAVIGGNGMLGTDLVGFFSKKYKVTSISKENYLKQVGKTFDVLINANGNSKRFWANLNPFDDFSASTASVMKSMFDFSCDMYIYVSSVNVYENPSAPKYTKEGTNIESSRLEPYGFHKYLSELIVKKYKSAFLILRPSMILGTNLKKGPIFDILNGKPLLISTKSRIQLITSRAIAEIIDVLLYKSVINQIVNVGGVGTFAFSKSNKLFNNKIAISSGAKMQLYEMNTKKLRRYYPSLKSSEEYLKNFLLATNKTGI